MATHAPGSVIEPTFTCFDDAFEILALVAQKDQARARRMCLVHALCHWGEERYGAHAWIEEGSKCWFMGVHGGKKAIFVVYRREYYREICPIVMTKYTLQEALAVGKAWGKTGPWEAKYCLFTRQEEEC